MTIPMTIEKLVFRLQADATKYVEALKAANKRIGEFIQKELEMQGHRTYSVDLIVEQKCCPDPIPTEVIVTFLDGGHDIKNFLVNPDVSFENVKPLVKVEVDEKVSDKVEKMVDAILQGQEIPKRVFEGSKVEGLASTIFEKKEQERQAAIITRVMAGLGCKPVCSTCKGTRKVDTTTEENKQWRTYIPCPDCTTRDKVQNYQEGDLCACHGVTVIDITTLRDEKKRYACPTCLSEMQPKKKLEEGEQEVTGFSTEPDVDLWTDGVPGVVRKPGTVVEVKEETWRDRPPLL